MSWQLARQSPSSGTEASGLKTCKFSDRLLIPVKLPLRWLRYDFSCKEVAWQT